jgi:hypothetical protein
MSDSVRKHLLGPFPVYPVNQVYIEAISHAVCQLVVWFCDLALPLGDELVGVPGWLVQEVLLWCIMLKTGLAAFSKQARPPVS